MELARDRAAADAELEPPTREHVGRGRLLGAAQRMLEGQERDCGPDADAPGALGDHRHHHERVRQQRERATEVQLGQPRHVEAELVGARGQVEDLGVALGVRLAVGFRRLEEEPESHGATVA